MHFALVRTCETISSPLSRCKGLFLPWKTDPYSVTNQEVSLLPPPEAAVIGNAEALLHRRIPGVNISRDLITAIRQPVILEAVKLGQILLAGDDPDKQLIFHFL